MAQATVDLGLNTAAFTAGLNEAGQKAQTFEGRIAGLFRRSPLQRAERAFGELGANLATGNVAQGLASFIGRFTGFGLVAGAVVGAAIGVFQKFRGQITETTKAANELDKALAISGYATSAPQVEKSIEAISTAVDTLSQKSKGIGAKAFGIISPGFKKGLEEELNAALAQFAELEAKRPRAEAARTGIQAEALMGSEREAEKAAVRLDLEEKIAAIRARQTQESDKALESLGKASPEQRMKALTAIQKSAEASILNEQAAAALVNQKIDDKYNLKEKELGIDKDIAEQALRGASTEDQKISKLQQELSLIQEQLSGAEKLTDENRKQLETSELKTRAELAATLRSKIGSGAQDLVKNNIQFGSEMLGEDRLRKAQRAIARAEGEQLEFETQGRSRTPGEASALQEYKRAGKGTEESLLAERRDLIRQQAQAQEMLEDAIGTRAEGTLGSLGNVKYRIRQNRLAEIDRQLAESGVNAIRNSPTRNEQDRKAPLTKADFQSALETVLDKYWGN